MLSWYLLKEKAKELKKQHWQNFLGRKLQERLQATGTILIPVDVTKVTTRFRAVAIEIQCWLGCFHGSADAIGLAAGFRWVNDRQDTKRQSGSVFQKRIHIWFISFQEHILLIIRAFPVPNPPYATNNNRLILSSSSSSWKQQPANSFYKDLMIHKRHSITQTGNQMSNTSYKV